eukprot:TRINITY_DN20154_c0_g2_i1.p1 TRINITY_DN20154_c0_g2~~TRINITY_DN20154_c0_g2_i1.p1  ORF type:complete len:840 (+),score=281.39 TRINITY_DN20154_c0_g2_i1:45-2564(+)
MQKIPQVGFLGAPSGRMTSLIIFALAVSLCADGAKLNQENGFLARHPVKTHLKVRPTLGELKQRKLDEANRHVSSRKHRMHSDPSEPDIEVLELAVEKQEGADAQAVDDETIDASVIKTKTEMVMPQNYAVGLVHPPTPLPRKIGANADGACVCPMGKFLHWQTKKCVSQKTWGFECGFFPRQQQNRVCKDGLYCKRLDKPDNYRSTGIYEGWAGTAPATCDHCQEGDNCKVGKKRHEEDCVREGDLQNLDDEQDEEDEELKPWENDDMFEAWGGKGADLDAAKLKNLGKDKKAPLSPFGRAEPKMCVTVQVTLPQLTVEKNSTRVIESRVTAPLKVVVNASKGANATATATAEAKRRSMVKSQASATASYTASAAAEASYTAYASSTKKDTASHQVKATAEASRKIAGTGHKANIKTEATAVASATEDASVTVIENATRSARAKETAGVEATVTQTGTGDAEATAKKEVTVTVNNWTASASRTATVNATGVGSLTKNFKASATAKAIVETRSCVSAHQARKMLGKATLEQSGVEFARAVYKKAQREAYAKAKSKGLKIATEAATLAAGEKAAIDIETQIEKFTKEHEAELNEAALKDAWKSTEDTQKELQAEAEEEASKKAQVEVKKIADAKAKAVAMEKAKTEAENKATAEAKAEAEEEAQEGIKARAFAKAKEEAQETANEKAKAAALKSAKEKAEKAAKALAKKSAAKAAKKEAKQEAKAAATEKAVAKAVKVAKRMAGTGAEGVKEDISESKKAEKKSEKVSEKKEGKEDKKQKEEKQDKKEDKANAEDGKKEKKSEKKEGKEDKSEKQHEKKSEKQEGKKEQTEKKEDIKKED